MLYCLRMRENTFRSHHISVMHNFADRQRLTLNIFYISLHHLSMGCRKLWISVVFQRVKHKYGPYTGQSIFNYNNLLPTRASYQRRKIACCTCAGNARERPEILRIWQEAHFQKWRRGVACLWLQSKFPKFVFKATLPFSNWWFRFDG